MLCGLVGRLPSRFSDNAARAIGGFGYAAASFERRCAKRQLQSALGKRLTPNRARILARGVFHRLAQNAIEMLRMHRFPERFPDAALSETSRRALDNALAEGRGVIFVTAHLGNWELMAATLAKLGYPIHTVAKRSYDPRFTELIENSRTRFGVRAVYRGDPGAATAMLRVLRGNGILGFLIDQDTDVPSVFAPFFGRPAKTPTGPAVFARRTGASMVLGTISRRTGGPSHRIDIIPVPLETDPQTTVSTLNRILEARIRRHPSEWVWFHRRWKSRPDSEIAA